MSAGSSTDPPTTPTPHGPEGGLTTRELEELEEDFRATERDLEHDMQDEVNYEEYSQYPRIAYPSSSRDSSDSESECPYYYFPSPIPIVDLADLPEYEIGIHDYYTEDLALPNIERVQEEIFFRDDRAELQLRERQEWPEIMAKHPEESRAAAHRRHLILNLVRFFLQGL